MTGAARDATTGFPARATTDDDPTRRAIAVIGAPTDVGAGTRGSRMGPAALRVADLIPALEARGRAVLDRGDLSGPDNPWRDRVDGCRHLDEVVAWNERVHDAVLAELREGHVPLLLGGDHSVAIGSIAAVARHCRDVGRRLRVLWFDAHADINTAAGSPTGNLHGMPVASLLGFGPAPLARIGGTVPAIEPSWLRQIGLRSVDPDERRVLRDIGAVAFDMRFIDEAGMGETMRRALDGVDADTHLHVSFDVDFLDADLAPGVGTATRGGPSYREAHLCMEMIADVGGPASMDLVELNPAFDVRNRTALVAIELVESAFGKSTLLADDARGGGAGGR